MIAAIKHSKTTVERGTARGLQGGRKKIARVKVNPVVVDVGGRREVVGQRQVPHLGNHDKRRGRRCAASMVGWRRLRGNDQGRDFANLEGFKTQVGAAKVGGGTRHGTPRVELELRCPAFPGIDSAPRTGAVTGKCIFSVSEVRWA